MKKSLGQRTFMVPSLATLFAVMNQAAELGFDFKTTVLVVASSLLWAAIETWRDVVRIRAEAEFKVGVYAPASVIVRQPSTAAGGVPPTQ